MAQQSRPGGGTPSRIVVADDHPLIREALTRTIDEQPDLEAVGEATDGFEALELCRRFQPELVLMDVLMPRMDGLEATRQIKRESPRTSVLVLSAVEDPIYLSEALKAGAAGYVQKGATTQETLEAMRKVLEGESSLDQKVATQLLKRLMEDPKPEPNGRAKGKSSLELLSARESEVLGLVARGYTNQQIARSLLISVSTVKKHVRSAISKLGVSDRTQAAVRAVELGVLAQCKEEQLRRENTIPQSRDYWDGSHKVHMSSDQKAHMKGDQKDHRKGPLGPCTALPFALTLLSQCHSTREEERESERS